MTHGPNIPLHVSYMIHGILFTFNSFVGHAAHFIP